MTDNCWNTGGGVGVKMEHFQATLDPRKQELLEARFLGARGGRNNGPSKNAIDNAQSSSIPSVVKCGQPTTPGIDWTRRDNAPPSRDQRNSSSSTTALGQVSQEKK
ncbi:hypothetical protein PV327_010438 [Microctonus hyperodae]|uniref:Uncharacterized protein n=1 Tax=Microctonus hyperodae TaxID=165561 RepID=A0AA39KUX9_MICHY|nr:hypothetical protein PV327_010438 [Microctonus hyperodae]